MGDEEEACGVVVDNGSENIKAGFSGADAPRAVFRPVIGYSKVNGRVGEKCISLHGDSTGG